MVRGYYPTQFCLFASDLKITNAFPNLEDLQMVMSTVIAVIKNSLEYDYYTKVCFEGRLLGDHPVSLVQPLLLEVCSSPQISLSPLEARKQYGISRIQICLAFCWVQACQSSAWF